MLILVTPTRRNVGCNERERDESCPQEGERLAVGGSGDVSLFGLGVQRWLS